MTAAYCREVALGLPPLEARRAALGLQERRLRQRRLRLLHLRQARVQRLPRDGERLLLDLALQ